MGTAPLDRLRTLDPLRRRAFLALFPAERRLGQLKAFKFGPETTYRCPNFGKAECEWVEDWYDFYSRELPALGFTTYLQGPERVAAGALAGSLVRDVVVTITLDGREAREAYWAAVEAASAYLEDDL